MANVMMANVNLANVIIASNVRAIVIRNNVAMTKVTARLIITSRKKLLEETLVNKSCTNFARRAPIL